MTMLSRRSLIATAAAAGLVPVLAEANHLSWRRFMYLPKPLAKVRVIEVPIDGSVSVTDGAGDEDALVVAPDGPMRGRAVVAGFRGIYCIGGVCDPAGDGNMYDPRGDVVWGCGDSFNFQTARTAVTRPFIYFARWQLKRTDPLIYGDFLRLGGAARLGEWGMWPDVYRHLILAAAHWGWEDSETVQFGDAPAPRHTGATCKSDFVKQDTGPTRHWWTGGIDVAWGFQGEYAQTSWTTGNQCYQGPDGRAVRKIWDYVARPQYRADLGQTKAWCYAATPSDKSCLTGQYDPMEFHGPGGLEGKGCWIKPVSGHESGEYIPPWKTNGAPAHFAAHNNGVLLTWPQTDWPDNVPAYSGVVGLSASPPSVVTTANVGLAWRVKTVAELHAYRDENKHLI